MDKNFNKKRLRNKYAMTDNRHAELVSTSRNCKLLALPSAQGRQGHTYRTALRIPLSSTRRDERKERSVGNMKENTFNDTAFSRFNSLFSLKASAFTLAEILITLGIIGVVAALTLPTLIENHKKQVLQNQFKQAYSILSQVNQQMLNDDISTYNEFVPTSGTELSEVDAIRHIDSLAKYLNGKVCEDHFLKCTGGEKYKTLDGKTYAHIDADAFCKRTILLNNGMTLWRGGLKYETSRYYIDINGTGKGPNKLGYDLFRFYIDANDKLLPDNERLYGNNKCSFSSQASNGAAYTGFGCTYYALADQNPEDKTKSYWKDFLK